MDVRHPPSRSLLGLPTVLYNTGRSVFETFCSASRADPSRDAHMKYRRTIVRRSLTRWRDVRMPSLQTVSNVNKVNQLKPADRRIQLTMPETDHAEEVRIHLACFKGLTSGLLRFERPARTASRSTGLLRNSGRRSADLVQD